MLSDHFWLGGNNRTENVHSFVTCVEGFPYFHFNLLNILPFGGLYLCFSWLVLSEGISVVRALLTHQSSCHPVLDCRAWRPVNGSHGVV